MWLRERSTEQIGNWICNLVREWVAFLCTLGCPVGIFRLNSVAVWDTK